MRQVAVCWFYHLNDEVTFMTSTCRPVATATERDDFEIIFVKSFWHKQANRRITAAELGLKAIPLKIRRRMA